MDGLLRPRRALTSILTAASLALAAAGWAQVPEDAGRAAAGPAETAPETPSSTPPPLADIGAYFTAPLRWDGRDWAWFGGTALAVGLAHRYDRQVRTHFVGPGPAPILKNSDTRDAIPTAAVFGGTWALAILTADRDGYREGWAMVEAAALSGVTDYALKFASGRQTPEQTSNPNQWFKSGTSFPSFHTTEAFAVGTVLAESGNDDYRFLRRVLGYGIGAFTGYQRLKHNAHWLSDTVAGAALGIASAHFAMDRRYASESHFALVPIEGGAMLTYRVSMP